MVRDSYSSLDKKPLFKQMPEENAGVEEWRDWALELHKWAYATSEREKQRRKQLKRLRKELAKKNAVFEHYKRRIVNLENQVSMYESSVLIRMYRRVRRILDTVTADE